MKNQYFGDKRDLLKYSLLEALVQGVPSLNQLTCIWLLTPPSSNNDGNQHFRQREGDSNLALFLGHCIATDRRDVRELATYMAGRAWKYSSVGDGASQYFTAMSRTDYFRSIPDSVLRHAVVFFDPDNGLEPTRSATPAHLKYAELRSVFHRMDGGSIAMVYQHLPRRRAESFWPLTALKVRAALDCSVGFVASGAVGFLIALRDRGSQGRVSEILADFRSAWPASLRIGGPD